MCVEQVNIDPPIAMSAVSQLSVQRLTGVIRRLDNDYSAAC